MTQSLRLRSLFACLVLGACSTAVGPDDGSGPPPPPAGCVPAPQCNTPPVPGITPDSTPPTVFTAAIISPPVAPPLVDPASPAMLVYVSLLPGTLPGAVSLNIVNHRNRALAFGHIIAGGVDPIAIVAAVGDTLGFIVISADGLTVSREQIRVVPSSQAPVVVRTEPIQGRDAVLLYAKLKVVFSVPLALGTLTDGGLQLQTGGVAVRGTVAFDGPDHTRVTFTPADHLLPGREYLINFANTIQDVAGNSLLAPVPVLFTSEVPVYSIYERVTPDLTIGLPSRFIFSSGGLCTIEYGAKFGGTDWAGLFSVDSPSYQITATGISFDFGPYGTSGWQLATATRFGSSIAVRYNFFMSELGYEDGTYILTDGPGLP
ncbi:MAG: Ig-like domain-containing protein [Gemmatimonadota bacterium]